jgi:two-component system OmpR family response regulator
MAKILAVEDEEDYRELLEHVLSEAGFEIVTAPNGEEGLEAYAKENPDLVLLDVNLPDMDGFDICRKIREEGPRKDVPILFCTIRSSVARVSEGLSRGANDYVVKPFQVDDLLARVRKALGQD